LKQTKTHKLTIDLKWTEYFCSSYGKV